MNAMIDRASLFYIIGHLGLGDHLLCNAIVRHFAKIHEAVVVPCYHHNKGAVCWMFSDLKNVSAQAVTAEELHAMSGNYGEYQGVRLGHYKFNPAPFFGPVFDPLKFDQEFYGHADLPFELRWSGFKLPYIGESAIAAWSRFPSHYSIIVHHDPERGFEMKWGDNKPRTEINKNWDLNSSAACLMQAEEIHVINSSMLILADSIPTKAKRLVLHHYARPTTFPALKKNWEILR